MSSPILLAERGGNLDLRTLISRVSARSKVESIIRQAASDNELLTTLFPNDSEADQGENDNSFGLLIEFI